MAAMPRHTTLFVTVWWLCRDMLQAHNALLHVYASHGQVDKAKQLFSSMQERGPAVDSVSAGTLIAAYAKAGHLIHRLIATAHLDACCLGSPV